MVAGIPPGLMASGPVADLRPNVLIITTHDSGRHFGCYGVPTVRTPHIDALASDGVLFEQMFSASPICSPGRGSLLTGRYPLANGLVGLSGNRYKWELNDYHQHLSWILRKAGYRTAMIGLQHETDFIERLGFEDISAHGVSPEHSEGSSFTGWPVKNQGRSAAEVAGSVEDYLRRTKDDERPFYIQAGFFETHTEFDFADCPPDETLGVWAPPYSLGRGVHVWARRLNRYVSDPDYARQHLAGLQGSLVRVDDAVGRIMAALRETGLEKNTLVLFNTEHGVELPGSKWTLYDPGLGVAFILRWPAGGAVGGRRCPWLLSNIDFVPTLMELIQMVPPENLQGVSFSSAVRGDIAGRPSPRAAAFGNWVDGLNFSIRTERFKLIRNLFPVPDSTGRVCSEYELYDLSLDPDERVNVCAEPVYAGELARMQGLLQDWLVEMNDPSVDGPVHGEDLTAAVAEYRRRYEEKNVKKTEKDYEN